MKTTQLSRGCFVLLRLFILSLVLPLSGCGEGPKDPTTPIQLTDEVKAQIEARKKANKSPKQQQRAGKPGGGIRN
jgi:hypothetical protein